jgi:mutator protein MutT
VKKILEKWEKFMNEIKEARSFSSCVVVLNDEGKILFLKREDSAPSFPGAWGFPGGGSDEGETKEECARREMYEETGLKANNLTYIDESRNKNKSIYFFKCVDFSGQVDTKNVQKEHTDFKWVDPSDLDNYNIVPDSEPIIRKAFGQMIF